jgi:isopenicillin N synthase-like dioxygenase
VSLPHKNATGMMHVAKYWEIITDNLSKAGRRWGCVSGVDSRGRRSFVADAYRDGNQRFVVRADEKLTAFIELEWAIRGLTREGGGHIAFEIELKSEIPAKEKYHVRRHSPLPL